MHGLKHQNYLIMENTPSQVNWHPVNRAKLPGMHQMGSLQEIAHGADSVMYFQLHQSRGASEMFHGAVITNKLSNKTRVFKDVKQVGEALDSLAEAKDSKRLDAKSQSSSTTTTCGPWMMRAPTRIKAKILGNDSKTLQSILGQGHSCRYRFH